MGKTRRIHYSIPPARLPYHQRTALGTTRKGMSAKRTRAWVFTAWEHLGQNPSSHNYAELRIAGEKGDAYISYICYQREVTATGMKHWQGYLELNQRLTMSKLKQLLNMGDQVHLEQRRGNQQQGISYTKKTDTSDWGEDNSGCWREFGTLNPDLSHDALGSNEHQTLRILMEGVTQTGAISPATMYKHFQFINRYRWVINQMSMTMCQQRTLQKDLRTTETEPRNPQVICTVLYGPPASGKTSWVKETYVDNGDLYIVEQRPSGNSQSALWWDGYLGHHVILIDDISTKTWEPGDILRYTSGTGHNLNTKGGTVISQWLYMYITTNVHPNLWWPNDNSFSTDALERRIKTINCNDHENPEWREQIPTLPEHHLCKCQRQKPYGLALTQCENLCNKFSELEHCQRPVPHGFDVGPLLSDTTVTVEPPIRPFAATIPRAEPRTGGQHQGPRESNANTVNTRPEPPRQGSRKNGGRPRHDTEDRLPNGHIRRRSQQRPIDRLSVRRIEGSQCTQESTTCSLDIATEDTGRSVCSEATDLDIL